MNLTPKKQYTYVFSAYRDGLNYCLEVKTPFARQFHVFPTFAGYKEYVDGYMQHLKWSGHKYQWDSEVF